MTSTRPSMVLSDKLGQFDSGLHRITDTRIAAQKGLRLQPVNNGSVWSSCLPNLAKRCPLSSLNQCSTPCE